MADNSFASWEEAVAWLLQSPGQQELVRACYYDRPPLAAAQRFAASEEWSAVRGYFPNCPGGEALDVGAGMGIASYALAMDGWRVSALEPDPSGLVGAGAIRALAHQAGLAIDVVEEWGESLPFERGRFSLVHARQVLHHARDLPRLCSEIARVLKPGGRLIATREHVISSASQIPAFLENHPLHNLYGGENAFRLAEYRGALRDAGFSIDATLGPLESVINYAPFSQDSLCDEIGRRLSRVPAGRLLARFAFAAPWRSLALRLASRMDRRPGRLYSFVCTKPGGGD